MLKSNKKVRVTLDLTPQFYERLEQLEDLVGASSKADVIRQALQFYEFAARSISDGDTFQTVDKDGRVETLVILGPDPQKREEMLPTL